MVPLEFDKHRPVRHQTSGSCNVAPFVHRRDASPSSRVNDPLTLDRKARGGRDEEGIGVCLRDGLKDGFVTLRAGNVGYVEVGLGCLCDLADLAEISATGVRTRVEYRNLPGGR